MGAPSIAILTMSAIGSLFLFVLAFLFLAKRIYNAFFALFLIDLGFQVLASSLDYVFIERMVAESHPVAIAQHVLAMMLMPLFYVSARKLMDMPIGKGDLPVAAFFALVNAASAIKIGMPDESPAGSALLILQNLYHLAFAILATRLLYRRDAGSPAFPSRARATMGAIGKYLIVLILASSVLDLIDRDLGMKATSLALTASLFALSAYLVYRSSKALRPPEGKYAGSTLDAAGAADIYAAADRALREEKLFSSFGLSLADLAERLGLSPKRLSQAINQTAGKNFSQFINDYRINEAMRLLREKESSAADICFSVGFNSLSSFYEQFRRRVGSTPDRFRNAE